MAVRALLDLYEINNPEVSWHASAMAVTEACPARGDSRGGETNANMIPYRGIEPGSPGTSHAHRRPQRHFGPRPDVDRRQRGRRPSVVVAHRAAGQPNPCRHH